MTREDTASPQETYYWVVYRKGRDEIQIWSDRESAEQAIDSITDAQPGELFLYHVADSEMKRAFPNRPIAAGDVEVDLSNKYVKKGWKPGQN